MQYSVPLANWLASHDYELYAKNDFRFVEGVYKVSGKYVAIIL